MMLTDKTDRLGVSEIYFHCTASGDRLWPVQVRGCGIHDEDVLWHADLLSPGDPQDGRQRGLHQSYRLLESRSYTLHHVRCEIDQANRQRSRQAGRELSSFGRFRDAAISILDIQ